MQSDIHTVWWKLRKTVPLKVPSNSFLPEETSGEKVFKFELAWNQQSIRIK